MCVGLKSCRFIPSYVRLGLGGGELGSSFLLPRIVGRQRAASILLTGRDIDSTMAEQWGILSKVVSSDEELAAECINVAADMVSLSPKGLRFTKWLLNESHDMTLDQCLGREDLNQIFMSQSNRT